MLVDPLSRLRGSRRGVPAVRRQRFLRVLVVDEADAEAERYIHELRRAHFAVSAQVAHNAIECVEFLASRPYDIILCNAAMQRELALDVLDILQRSASEIPVIAITGTTELNGGQEEVVANFLFSGAADTVDRRRLNLLPLAVALAVDERALRDERARAEQALRYSQAQYRALSENPTYGVCRIDTSGRLVDANPTIASLLGYQSREHLLALNLTDIIADPTQRTLWRDACHRGDRVDGLELDMTRRDGSLVHVRVGARRIEDADPDWELIVEDITAQRALEGHLRHLASTDPLTGLANYRQFAESFDTEIRRSQRTGRSFAVLLLDLDQMKQINDRYGHLTGNRALCRVADVLRNTCRLIDTPARYGGDEFAVVLPETGPREARVVGHRIRELLARDVEAPALSTSVGTAVYPDDGDTMERLLISADSALYRMKGSQDSTEREG